MKSRLVLLVVIASMLSVCTPSWAEKPDWAGHGKSKKHPVQDEPAVQIEMGTYFRDEQRQAVRGYYGTRAAKGHCPPGLAKKHNGCLPPGQAKKWVRGQPLPSTVVWYPVPNEVVVQIGLPPRGYKYVRVANDILLIAVGTSLVVDAIEDLMR